VWHIANVDTLPDFGGLADGIIVPANYNGVADELQTCAPADPVPDGTVSLQPEPVQGEEVTVWYVSTNGPLEDADTITLHYGFDGEPLNSNAEMSPTSGLTDSEWIADVSLPADALIMEVNFSSNGTVDDNHGQNWFFHINRPATSEEPVVIDPNPAEAGQPVTVVYDPVGRVLEGADAVQIHYGFNNWGIGVTDADMTRRTDCKWEITFTVDDLAFGEQGLNMVFHDGAGTWDNNDGNDWHFPVTSTSSPPWVMDGRRDPYSTLFATNEDGTRHLYAGICDGWMYVATEAATGGNDHFIFINSNGPTAMTGAPWAKAGQVGAYAGMLCQEVDNGWNGWQNGPVGSIQGLTGPQSTTNPWLEGQFRIADNFSPVPASVWLAVGVYGTNSGSPLEAWAQIPVGNGDGDINLDEYLETVLAPHPADFDEDCDVDLVDFIKFLPCYHPLQGDCLVDADFNDDGVVDLEDFKTMQLAFEGVE
jgi:hypothetical protein